MEPTTKELNERNVFRFTVAAITTTPANNVAILVTTQIAADTSGLAKERPERTQRSGTTSKDRNLVQTKNAQSIAAAEPLGVVVAGEELQLYPEHAIYWAREATLLVADTHWGKAATFRSAAIPLPDTEVESDLARLSRLLIQTEAKRLIVLGDLLYHRQGRDEETFNAIGQWRAEHFNLEIALTEGNHDRSAGSVPVSWRIDATPGDLNLGPFILRHFPDPSDAGYVISGHLHPKARLVGAGSNGLTLPCFWFQDQIGVLPAFGSLCGGAVISPQACDRVYVTTDDSVISVGADEPNAASSNA